MDIRFLCPHYTGKNKTKIDIKDIWHKNKNEAKTDIKIFCDMKHHNKH